MRVKCVVTSFGQVAAMGNVHLGLAARIRRILIRGNCCLGGVLPMDNPMETLGTLETFLANRIRVIENVYGI